jgi:hypothetical protein
MTTRQISRLRYLLFFAGQFLFMQWVSAQTSETMKFGKITPADFQLSAEKFDSGASAVIIADIGTVKFEGNTSGYFNIIFTRFMRVRIMNKNGLDIGSREISLFHSSDGDIEKIISIKGSTYNLEHGSIQETKLDEKSIFTQKYNNNIDDKKFSMPALKEGSVFDLEYSVRSPFTSRMEPWSFQGDYPALWSEFTVTIPSPLHYVVRIQGDEHFKIDTAKLIPENYNVRVSNEGYGTATDKSYTVTGNSTYRRWVKTNVPSLHEEPFTSTIDNFYSKISFQLDYIQWNKESEKHFQKSTWNLLSKDLMADEDFGASVNNDPDWLTDEVNKIVAGLSSDSEKVVKLYMYVRDNFKSDGRHGIYKDGSLKDIFRKRSGKVADINLLLTAMILKANIKAQPMILSTRSHGLADPSYPLVDEYNYVICMAFPVGQFFTLDASRPYLKFGQIPLECYNGYGHIIDPVMPVPIFFSADSVVESSLTRVIIIDDEKGKLTGNLTSTPGRSETYDIRATTNGSSLNAYEKKVRDLNGSDLTMENFGIDSLGKYDFPISIHYDFNLKNSGSPDIIYFNPMLGERNKTNPFKSADRLYPVEIPYCIESIYTLNMDIPAGYQVDEIPKSARVAYNENEGMFEYLIQHDAEKIQMRVKLSLKKAFFPTDEYSTLRDFFAYVVKKESEQIVFKRIK